MKLFGTALPIVALGAFVVSMLMIVAPASAQTDMRTCMSIADDAARIRCYDGLSNSPAPTQPAPSAPAYYPQSPVTNTVPYSGPVSPGQSSIVTSGPGGPVAPGSGAAVPGTWSPSSGGGVRPGSRGGTSAVATYGLPERPQSDQVANYGIEEATVRQDNRGRSILNDRIAEVETTGLGFYIVTLASGQVWRQTSADRYQMRPGQQVTIRPSSYGPDFRLSAEGSPGFIQVERVR